MTRLLYASLLIFASSLLFLAANAQQPSSAPQLRRRSHGRPRQRFQKRLQRQSSNDTAPPPTTPPPITPSPSPLDYKIGRRFFISSDGEMSQILSKEQDYLDSVQLTKKFFSYVEDRTLTFLRTKRVPPADQPLRPCNSNGARFKKAMISWFDARGLPVLDASCTTEFFGTVAYTNETDTADYTISVEELYDALEKRARAVSRNAQRIADTLLGNWSNVPNTGDPFIYSSVSEQCQVRATAAVRLYDKWYFPTGITNADREQNLKLFDRMYLSEVIYVDENGVMGEPLRFKSQKRPPPEAPPDAEHVWQNDTTTVLGAGQGAVRPSTFGSWYVEELPALQAALDKMDLSIQQAQDALAPSSLAILFLPLFLNMVPIALLAQVQTSFMLMYTVMSDVVTVIPLGIKGVELIHIGQARHRESTMRISSAVNGTRAEGAAVQLYVAECRAQDSVLVLGIVFLSIAVAALVMGVALEFIAKACVTRRNLNRRLFQAEHEPLVGSQPSTLRTNQDFDPDGAIGASRARGGADFGNNDYES